MDISILISNHETKASKLTKIVKNHEKAIALAIATLLMFLAQRHINIQTLLGDSWTYWDLSSTIWNFSFPHSIRGYFYPLLLSPSRLISDNFPSTGYSALYLTQALTFAFTLSIALPYVFTTLIGGRLSLIKRLLPPFLVSIFFPTLVAYTLSDLPAFCMIIGSLALISLASQQNNVARATLIIFIAGILAYGAYNTRTIYLFSLALLIPALPLAALKGRKVLHKIILTAFFGLGLTTAALPQTLINLKHLDSFTPLVVADLNGSSLFASQLKWGITIQRYETGFNSDTGAIFSIFYMDPIGERLTNQNKLGDVPPSISWYLDLLLSEPLPFIKIYIKHIVNGLDVRDDDTYTKVRSKENKIRSIASLSISIFGLFCLILLTIRSPESTSNTVSRKSTYTRLAWLAVIIIPVAAIVPGAIETRFFLPLHVMAYCAIAFGVSHQCIKSISFKSLMLLSMFYSASVGAAYYLATASVSNPLYELPT